jgi:hypothetical protein
MQNLHTQQLHHHLWIEAEVPLYLINHLQQALNHQEEL